MVALVLEGSKEHGVNRKRGVVIEVVDDPLVAGVELCSHDNQLMALVERHPVQRDAVLGLEGFFKSGVRAVIALGEA